MIIKTRFIFLWSCLHHCFQQSFGNMPGIELVIDVDESTVCRHQFFIDKWQSVDITSTDKCRSVDTTSTDKWRSVDTTSTDKWRSVDTTSNDSSKFVAILSRVLEKAFSIACELETFCKRNMDGHFKCLIVTKYKFSTSEVLCLVSLDNEMRVA